MGMKGGRMPNILLAVDGSEASLRAVRGLTGVFRWWKVTDVEILNVQPEPSLLSELVPHALREHAEARVRQEGERALATADALLRDAGARCVATVRFGDPATAINHAAEALDGAIIAMGSHGAGVIGSLLTGSVTTKVIHLGSRPVLVIPSAQPLTGSTYGPPQRAVRILMPVDGSAGAAAAVREVIRIAPWFLEAPEIHLLAVYEGTPLDVEIGAMASAQALRDYQQQRFAAALRPAREAFSGTAFPVFEHTAVGPPAEKIRAAVAAEHCDLVCLGARGTGTMRHLIPGSTAAKALRAIDVPVLVVPSAAA
jgi:nucleotide-binding universal stress UspA family protein